MLVRGYFEAGFLSKQSAELRQELDGPFPNFYLDMGISPLPPMFSYVFVLWSPFYLHSERLSFYLLCCTRAV